MDSLTALYQEAVAAQSRSDLAQAAALYRRLLAAAPRHAPAQNNLGTVLFASGQQAEALQCFRAAVAADPAYGEAQANLGKALAMTGNWQGAVPALRLAVQGGTRDPDTVRALSVGARRLGSAAMAANDWRQAASHWRLVLELSPQDIDAAVSLAQSLQASGDLDAAASLYEEAVAAHPERDEAWTNLGAIREARGDYRGAEDAYRHAWTVAPENVAAGFNLGRLVVEQGLGAEALAILQTIAPLAPGDLDVQLALATAFAETRDLTAAEALCQRLLAEAQEPERIWLTLGNIRQAADRLDDAALAYEAATLARADYVPAWRNLGSVHMAAGRLEAAAVAFDRAQRLQFDPGIAFRAALMLPPMVESPAAIKAARKRYQKGLNQLRELQVRLQDPLLEVGSTAFYLAYHGVNDRQLQQETAKLYLQACPELGWTAPLIEQPRQDGERLRVGFASTFLRRHTIGRLYGQFITRLDRRHFEVWVFQSPGEDPLATAIAESADHRVVLSGDLVAMREQIASARLEALIYPDIGMEPTTYFLAFARLAPVQAVLWGHPMTTGIPNVDYFLSAVDMEIAEGQAHYSEDLIRLPSVNTCFRRPEVPSPGKSRHELGLPAAGALYVCPQSLFKFHPEFDRACMAILAGDPTGTLVLLQDSSRQWQDDLLRRFAAVDPSAAGRVLFLPRLSESDFFSLLRCADVSLDPFHFGGGNTTLEAFAMGTPVVTLPSDYLRGRITYALYRQMGMADLIATDAADYVALAHRVAHDRDWRQRLSATIAAASGRVFENEQAVRELEAFLLAACQAAEQGRRLHDWRPSSGAAPGVPS